MEKVDQQRSRPFAIDIELWTAIGSPAALLLLGSSRCDVSYPAARRRRDAVMYRGVAGERPEFLTRQLPSDDMCDAFSGDRGMHVLESVQVQKPLAEVDGDWRQLEKLPRSMATLTWCCRGPRPRPVTSGGARAGGPSRGMDAQTINEIENEVIGLESLPGSDVVTAGSVNFDSARTAARRTSPCTCASSRPAGAPAKSSQPSSDGVRRRTCAKTCAG